MSPNFDLLSIPILSGRNFTLEETVSETPVAIVSTAAGIVCSRAGLRSGR